MSYHSSLKSSHVSTGKTCDHTQALLVWSVVPIAALIAMGVISSSRLAYVGEFAREGVPSQVSYSFEAPQ